MECVCGKKSPLGGVRQLFLQQLRQRRGRRQERVCRQSDSRHGNRDHRSWQGDPSTHCRCQKRAGILQQVHTFQFNRSLSVLCTPIVALRLCIFKESFFPFPSKLSPIQFNFHLLFFFLLLLPSFCLRSPLYTYRVFKPAVRRYVLLQVWNGFMQFDEVFPFKKLIRSCLIACCI